MHLLECVQIKTLESFSVKICLTAVARVKVFPVPNGPRMRMGASWLESVVVIASTASFCLGLSLSTKKMLTKSQSLIVLARKKA